MERRWGDPRIHPGTVVPSVHWLSLWPRGCLFPTDLTPVPKFSITGLPLLCSPGHIVYKQLVPQVGYRYGKVI
jgi:hypothetical protein